MARKIYKKINGQYQWIDLSDDHPRAEAPVVHQDTLSSPLKHPVSGRMFDSRSAYLRECKRLGLEVIGNDKLSQKPRQFKDKVTEEKIVDAIRHAEAIHADPAKLRAVREDNRRRLERARELLYAKKFH